MEYQCLHFLFILFLCNKTEQNASVNIFVCTTVIRAHKCLVDAYKFLPMPTANLMFICSGKLNMYFRKIVTFQNTILVSFFIKTVSLGSYTDYLAKNH